MRIRTVRTVIAFAMTVSLAASGADWYVDATNGDDLNDGTCRVLVEGTNQGPRKTLCGAMAIPDLAEGDTVWLLPGDYNDGEYAWSGRSRCYISTPRLKIKSTDGKDVTFVTGWSASEPSDYRDKDGIRCFAIDSEKAPGVIIEGLTIRNGNSTYNYYGGGVYEGTESPKSALTDSTCWVVDCLFDSCQSGQGGGMCGGNALRTVFKDCYAYSRAASFNAGGYLVNCLLVNNRNQTAVDVNSTVVNCTIYGSTGAGVFGYTVNVYNSLIVGNKSDGVAPKIASNANAYDCVYGEGAYTNKYGTVTEHDCLSGVKVEDVGFISVQDGDFRMRGYSPAVDYGKADHLEVVKGLPEGESAYIDLLGQPIPTTGGINAGCTQAAVPTSIITAEGGGAISVEGGEEGENEIFADGTITVTAVDSVRRPFLGFELNGVMQPFAGNSISVEVSAERGFLASVKAVYTNEWYVDVNNGDDANTGATLARAKRTIRSATTNAVARDVIHVAQGVYGELEGARIRDGSSAADVLTRVIVPDYVTLKSIDGPEKTFIVGAKCPAENDESSEGWGCGIGAIRCVQLIRHATISGFTLTGGRARPVTTGLKDGNDHRWAGLYGSGSGQSTAENCIISNIVGSTENVAYAKLVNCRVLGNTLYDNSNGNGSAAYKCMVRGCLFAGNRGKTMVCNSNDPIESCTFGLGNYRARTGTDNAAFAVATMSDHKVQQKLKNCKVDRMRVHGEQIRQRQGRESKWEHLAHRNIEQNNRKDAGND